MISYVIEEAKKSKLLTDIYVNSDSDEIGKYSKSLGVEFYRRPDKLGNDYTTSDEYNYDFINKLFEVDFSIAKGGADELLGNCHPMAKEAGIECVFVLGKNGFSKFKKTIQLIKDGQHHDASEEIKNSKWYRQVPHRVEEISRKLREI